MCCDSGSSDANRYVGSGGGHNAAGLNNPSLSGRGGGITRFYIYVVEASMFIGFVSTVGHIAMSLAE